MTEKIEEFKQPEHGLKESGSSSAPSFAEELPNLPLDFLNIYGLIETVTAVPTGKPTRLFDQIKLYTDSISAPSIYRVYFYMVSLNAWHYCALT